MKKPDDASAAARRRLAYCRVTLLALSLFFGAVESWAYRFAMNPDGTAYLDLGDDFTGGDWQSFLNAYWSPVYPALLGVGQRLCRPTLEAQFAVAHGVNLLTYLFAAVCFDRFCTQLLGFTRGDEPESADAWFLAGAYAVFWWSCLREIGLEFITPDLLLTGAIYLCLALLLRLARLERRALGWCVFFGACLGFGYLCKAALFPLAPFLMLALGVLSRHLAGRDRLARVACAGVGMFLVSAPWLCGLSVKYGRATFGESGRLNVMWSVNRTAPAARWQGGGDTGTPEHPTRLVSRDPDVYEFGGPVGGTLPTHKDPVYWMSGARVRWDPAGYLRQFAQSYRLLELVVRFNVYGYAAALMLALALEWYFRQGRAGLWAQVGRPLAALWPLWLFAGAAVGMYAIVVVERRYVAPFLLLGVVLLFAAALAGRRGPESGPAFRASMVVVVLAFAFMFLPFLRSSLQRCWTGQGLEGRPLDDQQQAARALEARVVTAGSRVAVLGGVGALNQHWIRLLGARAVAELYEDQVPRLRSPQEFARTLDALRRAGADFAAVISPNLTIPPAVPAERVRADLMVIDLRPAP